MTKEYTEYSFVVQGSVQPTTRKALTSIRKFFPGAKIILSTWQGEPINSLSFDRVIHNEDPGGLPIMVGGAQMREENTNRQIVSTVEGLRAVTTPFAVKVRQDLVFSSSNLLTIFGSIYNCIKPGPRSPFESKILVSTFNTQDPHSFLGFKNQLSDWFMVGKTSDLLNYWSGPLIEWNQVDFDEDNWPDSQFKNGFQFGRFSAEQHIFNRWLSKHNIATPIYFRDPEYSLTEVLFEENFCFVSPLQAGIDNSKYRKLIRPTFSMKGMAAYLFTWSVVVEGFTRTSKTGFSKISIRTKLRLFLAFLYRKVVYKL